MKPRNLTQGNWDVNVAVFEAPGFDARVTASAKHMWFHVSIGLCFADVKLPIAEFKKAVDFIGGIDIAQLKPAGSSTGTSIGTHFVDISNSIGSFKKGKIVYRKTPAVVLIAPHGKRRNHSIALRLSLFKKIIHWYNSDI